MDSESTEIARLEEEVRDIDVELRAGVQTWTGEQAKFAHAFLMKEAKLTVTMQPAVTERIANEVPALRQQIESIADSARSALLSWGSSLSETSARAAASNPRDKFQEIVEPAREAFGVTMRAHGYAPDDSRVSLENVPNRPWQFYNPQTGTARSTHFVHDSRADSPLEALVRRRADCAYQIRRLSEEISKDRAAELWGD